MNLVHREGETGIPNDRRRTTLLSTGLDYKGDRFRTSLDLGYQKKNLPRQPDQRQHLGGGFCARTAEKRS